ncbi:DUF4476 domain-containing protein [Chitinophaga sp. GCM10012297]|uniref:DUF4476 domain-containing protein n=1 Tax=Chitinophaga chungangae TaxID=2821488 RepID=A0ABS3YBX7_9BACT|nr:DUF4476 domain-containing protein [Chitinophaga chungangae]MBO9152174.1 DUF4476 domain-containing protein [Chitinophaga chungangae]
MKLLYLFCCLLAASGLSAQDPSYFVYIQHEKQQPFYVKIDGKLLSSSQKGYVILPKLQAGKVPVTVGFPKSEAPEQQFVIRLNGSRDYGYLLKNTGEKEYALYDLQTFATLKSGGGAPPAEAPAEEVTIARVSDENATAEQKELINNVQADVEAALGKKTDTSEPPKSGPKEKSSFAAALDKVVTDDRPDDMPLELPKPKPTAPPVTEKVADVAPVAVTESAPVKKPRNRKRGRDREPLTEEEQALLSSVLEDEKKAAADEALREADTTAAVVTEPEGGEYAPAPKPVKEKKEKKPKKKRDQPEPEFIDFGAAGNTTPAEPAAAAVESAAETVGEGVETSAKDAREAKRQKRKAEREAAIREGEIKDSIANAEFNKDVAVTETEETVKEKKKLSLDMVNSDCGKVLEVDAFRKLLRTMNVKKTDEDMVDAFRKSTRNTCVSTEQVRALAQLIATEENRYQLLDAAYARTYDSQNFAGLSDLLKDDYYKGRFKAMLKK